MVHSCLFVKNRTHLTSALSITPSYLPNDFSDSGLVTDYRDWQIPLGRRFRSLKIWFLLRTYGASGLKVHICKYIQLGKMFHRRVSTRTELFRVFTPAAYALTVLTHLLVMMRKPQSEVSANRESTKAQPLMTFFLKLAAKLKIVPTNY